jgi:DNA-binding XRE family transcriptional regulator
MPLKMRPFHGATSRAKKHIEPGQREMLIHLGEMVRWYRLDRGLTQEALAESIGLSVPYLSLIENGKRNPPYTTVVTIAQALGISARDLAS